MALVADRCCISMQVSTVVSYDIAQFRPHSPHGCGQVWKERLEREQEELASLTGDDRERAEKLSKDRRVHPVDAPKGSLRARLLKQMTATESSSKTAVSDLLFNLCENEGELSILLRTTT